MAIDPNDKYNAAIAVSWLRKCTGNQDLCNYCPFAKDTDDCLTNLNTTAADLLEKLAGLRK